MSKTLKLRIKRVFITLMAFAMIFNFNMANVFAESTEDDYYAFPETKPTASIPSNIPEGTYEVPVYMYARYTEEASMGNGAIGHTAAITVENGTATAYLEFHDMPFLDAYGHLEQLWYYDTEGNRCSVEVDETEWLINESTMDRVKTIRKCHFVLPTTDAEIVCRVKVDAMGDSEQDARLVFDYSGLSGSSNTVDTTALNNKIKEAEAISNDNGIYTDESYASLQEIIELAKLAVSAPDLTDEYAAGFITLLQGAIDGLEKKGTDTPDNPDVPDVPITELEAKIAEAEIELNRSYQYTSESIEALTEVIDIAKNALTAPDLTEEYAQDLAELLQGKIDELKVNHATLKYVLNIAKSYNNDDGSYTEDSFEILQTCIAEAEKALESEDELSYDDSSRLENKLFSAVNNLKEAVTPVELEDGYYETTVTYYLGSYGLDDGINIHTDVEDEFMKSVFGPKMKFKLEDGIYTLIFTPLIDENEKYYFSDITISNHLYGYGSMEGTKEIDYCGSKHNVFDAGKTIIQAAIDNQYSRKSMYLYLSGYSKEEQSNNHENVTAVHGDNGKYVSLNFTDIDIDWANAVKIGEISIDKSELEKELEFADYMFSTDLSKFTDASVAAYKAAYDAAKEIFYSETVKQSEVREATEKLNKASYELVKNDIYLNAKILEASAIARGDASDEKWNALQNAISDATAVLENTNATQEQLKEQITKLADAVADFTKVTIDTSALEEKIADAEAIHNDDGKYTAESYTSLQEIIALAKSALTAPDLTQEYAEQFTLLLQSKIDALEEVSEPIPDVSGKYTVSIELRQFGNEDLSMGNEAIVPEAVLVVSESGSATLEMDLKSLTYLGRDGYLGWMKKVTKVLSENNYHYPIEILTEDAAVLEEYENVYDNFNDPDSSYADTEVVNTWYPKKISIPVTIDIDASTGTISGEDDILVQVYVPVMENILSGGGTKFARIIVDWSTLKEAEEIDETVDRTALKNAVEDAQTKLSQTETYTSASLDALEKILNEAINVLNDDNASQSQIDAKRIELNHALKALVEIKSTDRTALESMIADAKEVEKGKHTDTAWNEFQDAITTAQNSYKNNDLTQTEIDAAVNELKAAIQRFNNSELVSELDKNKLEDGIYSLTGNMVKVDKETASMADGAINHTIKLTVKDGKYYLSVDFKGLEIGAQLGYLSQLKYFVSGYSVDYYGNPEGDTKTVTIDSYQKDTSGNLVSDIYGTNYPDVVTFELIPEALEDGYVPLQVFVPVMESIAAGTGTQPVFLKLDWSTLKSTTADDPDFITDDSNDSNNNNNDSSNSNNNSSNDSNTGTSGGLTGGANLSGSSTLNGGSSLTTSGNSSLKSGTSGLSSGSSSLKSASGAKTGDGTMAGGWFVLIIISGLALTIVAIEKNERKKYTN